MQAGAYFVAEGPGVDGVEVDAGGAFEAGEGVDAPLEDDVPGDGGVGGADVTGAGVPLFVDGDGGAGGGVAGVEDVADAAELVGVHVPGLEVGVFAVDFQAGVAVAVAGVGDGVLVFHEHEVLVVGVAGAVVEVEFRVVGQAEEFSLGFGGEFVDGDELLVEVVEAGAGGSEPVLEDGDVFGAVVFGVELFLGKDAEGEEVGVFGGGEVAGGAELVAASGAVDVVAAGDDDVVAAAEEGFGGFAELGVGEVGDVAGGASVVGLPDGVDELADVVAAFGVGEVALLVGAGAVGDLVAVVGFPVVEGDDFEEVADEAEVGGALRGVVGKEFFVELSVDEPHFFGGGADVVVAAEVAGVGVGVGAEVLGCGEGVGEGSVGAAGDSPHFCAGEGVDLFDGAVCEPLERFGVGGVGRAGVFCGGSHLVNVSPGLVVWGVVAAG